MKKMMYLLFVFSLLPVAVVSADDFIDNRLQVNNSRLETEQEKTLGGQLDATESLFNEKDQKKLADEKRKQEKQLSDFIPALQMLAWSALLFGIAGYISYRIYRKEA